MTDQIDAVEPSNISASWDGLPAARITVFANPRGQWFDLEGNNAGAGLVATAIRQRFDAGRPRQAILRRIWLADRAPRAGWGRDMSVVRLRERVDRAAAVYHGRVDQPA